MLSIVRCYSLILLYILLLHKTAPMGLLQGKGQQTFSKGQSGKPLNHILTQNRPHYGVYYQSNRSFLRFGLMIGVSM